MNPLQPPEMPLRDERPSTLGRTRTISLSRSPRPYHRRSASIVEVEPTTDTGGTPERKTPPPIPRSSDSSESGTEADDERGQLLKGLPAPPLKVHKGLIGGTPFVQTPALSPFPSPPAIERDGRKAYFPSGKRKSATTEVEEQAKRQTSREKYTKRKRAEITRRLTETALLVGIGATSCCRENASRHLRDWEKELQGFAWVILSLYLAFPFRVALKSLRRGCSMHQALGLGFHVPSKFDPGALLYPVLLPCIVALSLVPQNPAYLLPNMILGLSSIPSKMVPWSGDGIHLSYFQWFTSVVPLIWPNNPFRHGLLPKPHVLKTLGDSALHGEILVTLCPLQKALLPALEYLTATSLEASELQLLSTGLINVLLFSRTPQMEILKALLWLGGIAMFISCSRLMTWEVALARVPTWKFSRRKRPTKGLFSKWDYTICEFLFSSGKTTTRANSSDEDEFEESGKSVPLGRTKLRLNMDMNGHDQPKLFRPTMSAIEPSQNGSVDKFEAPTLLRGNAKDQRRSTFSAFDDIRLASIGKSAIGRLRRSISPSSTSFLRYSLAQAYVRKWGYAFAVYFITLVVILIPIRKYIGSHALSGYEPFGWALGYLFGNLPPFRFWVVSNNLEKWIRIPARIEDASAYCNLGWVEHLRQTSIGPASTRLLLSAYCILVLLTGIGIVLRLSAVVEVDTRRKVFHGIMVAMLLPTIFIDPCFIALALVLILAIFLLLDLFRASQLPPISKPLTNFLAPYVDGRDHRGPVIVSHIFLLIGCAIPLWLSLAGVRRDGSDPWRGWDAQERDISMVSGVLCVGMGDAAASLIGRRFGRTKWYWGGGKSLEGSFAFTIAVTFGLMLSYAWLRVGGWLDLQGSSFKLALFKSLLAGTGASLLESTLTAANDNVVVPVGLWLLVRGLNL